MDTRHSRRNERRAAGVIDRRIGRLRAGEVVPARLELHYTARGEPRFARWAAALGDYITWDERRGGGPGDAR